MIQATAATAYQSGPSFLSNTWWTFNAAPVWFWFGFRGIAGSAITASRKFHVFIAVCLKPKEAADHTIITMTHPRRHNITTAPRSSQRLPGFWAPGLLNKEPSYTTQDRPKSNCTHTVSNTYQKKIHLIKEKHSTSQHNHITINIWTEHLGKHTVM